MNAQIVGICDVDGFLANPNGIDIRAVFAARQRKVQFSKKRPIGHFSFQGGKSATLFSALTGEDAIIAGGVLQVFFYFFRTCCSFFVSGACRWHKQEGRRESDQLFESLRICRPNFLSVCGVI